MSYLVNLTFRLAAGAARLPEEDRRRHAALLGGAQRDDGGFAGRQGPSDLYYTGFGLRGLALLGELHADAADRAARFLQQRLDSKLPSIDFVSLVLSAVLLEMAAGIDVFGREGRDRQAVVTDYLGRLHRDDGGYAKTERSPRSSTYHTFLAVSCRQLLGLPVIQPERTACLIRSRKREDGGFAELEPLRQGGTNPTAAAVAILQSLDALDEPIRQGAAQFLARMQNAEGGLRANARIPLADLLSTFTGLVALADLGALATVDLARARAYVAGLGQPAGGFRGGAWDSTVDVEYTFYGLATLALVSSGQ